MASNVTFNGTVYTVPAEGDSNWGTNVTNYLIAIASGCLQKTGGTFTLTSEIDFGASYGIKSLYIKSRATNPASAGQIRLGNTESIKWRNAANNADVDLTVNASNALQFGGTSLTLSGSIVNADINAAAAIALSKLAALTASRVLVSTAGGEISASSVSTTTLGYLDATSSIQTQLNGKQASGSYALTTGKLDQFASTTSAELAGVISDETGTGKLVFDTSPSLTTPSLGAATATSINSTTIPSSKTLVVTTDKLSALSATTSAELAGVISDETGSGALVFANTPTLVTPVLGAATGTSLALGSTLNASSILDLTSTSKGFLEPRMTTAQRDAISTPATGLQVYNTDSNKLNYYNGSAWTEVGSGSGGGVNYITETDGSVIGSWVTYADAAGTSPVDGTGGSPTVTFAVSTSSAMRGTSNFLFTHDAANRQGEGFSYLMTIAPSDQGKVLTLSFDYLVASGTYADDDLCVWFYCATSGTLLQGAPYKIKNSGIIEKFYSEIQVPSGCSSLRAIFHVTSTTATAYTMRFDDFSFGPQAKLYGSVTTDWVSYTPTVVGLGTPTINLARWKRIGDDISLDLRITGGTATGDAISITLPAGLSLDYAASQFLGFGISTNTTNPDFGVIWSSSTATNLLTLVNAQSATSGFSVLSGTALGNSVVISLKIRAKIVGWSSSQVLSSDANTRAISMIGYKAASQSLTAVATKVIIDTKVEDTHDCFDFTTNYRFTAKVPGTYVFKVGASFSTSATSGISDFSLYKNGVAVTGQNQYLPISSTTLSGGAVNFKAVAKAGDYFEIYTTPQFTVTLNSVNLSIEKISGPSQIGADSTVGAMYSSTAGNTVTNNTITYIDYPTKGYDTHGFCTGSGSGNVTVTNTGFKCVVPISGKYQIIINTQSASGGGWAAGEEWTPIIIKNGSQIKAGPNFAQATHSTYMSNTVIATLNLLSGDRIEPAIYQNSGGSVNMSTTATVNYFEIIRLGNY